MNTPNNICQSCGMPLSSDPQGGGSNADKSISTRYCSFCFRDGKFTDEGITLQQKIDHNVKIAVEKMGMTEVQAREMAEQVLPILERWKS